MMWYSSGADHIEIMHWGTNKKGNHLDDVMMWLAN